MQSTGSQAGRRAGRHTSSEEKTQTAGKKTSSKSFIQIVPDVYFIRPDERKWNRIWNFIETRNSVRSVLLHMNTVFFFLHFASDFQSLKCEMLRVLI